jgi:hypothetical protein
VCPACRGNPRQWDHNPDARDNLQASLITAVADLTSLTCLNLRASDYYQLFASHAMRLPASLQVLLLEDNGGPWSCTPGLAHALGSLGALSALSLGDNALAGDRAAARAALGVLSGVLAALTVTWPLSRDDCGSALADLLVLTQLQRLRIVWTRDLDIVSEEVTAFVQGLSTLSTLRTLDFRTLDTRAGDDAALSPEWLRMVVAQAARMPRLRACHLVARDKWTRDTEIMLSPPGWERLRT